MESTVTIALPTLTNSATSGANLAIAKIGLGIRLVVIIPLITLSNFCPPGITPAIFFTSLAILVAASAALNKEVILSAKEVSGFAAFSNSVFVLFNLSLIVFLMNVVCQFLSLQEVLFQYQFLFLIFFLLLPW